MNRFHQIEKTLGVNLADNRMFAHSVEFVLVDFGSKDGLKSWVQQHFMAEIESGYLKYYYTDKMKSWHASVAKNTSHRLATGDILVNLDCDNWTGYNGGRFVLQQFMGTNNDIVLHQVWDDSDGSFGRIGMRRRFFEIIGGYDEALAPMGYQDVDIMERIKALGLKYTHVDNQKYNKAIANTKVESCENVDSKADWFEMVRANFLMSTRNIAEGRLVANKNKEWGVRDGLFDIYGNQIKQ